jgi:hypothetical protein
MNHVSEMNPKTVNNSVAPDFLTVTEAGRALRISRTSAYRQANRYLQTGGADGIPVRRIGRQLRVPRAEFEAMAGGPITWPIPTTERSTSSTITPIKTPTTSRRSSRRASRSGTQSALPFPA